MVECKPEDLCRNPLEYFLPHYAHMVWIRLHHSCVYSVMPSKPEYFRPIKGLMCSWTALWDKESEVKVAASQRLRQTSLLRTLFLICTTTCRDRNHSEATSIPCEFYYLIFILWMTGEKFLQLFFFLSFLFLHITFGRFSFCKCVCHCWNNSSISHGQKEHDRTWTVTLKSSSWHPLQSTVSYRGYLDISTASGLNEYQHQQH